MKQFSIVSIRRGLALIDAVVIILVIFFLAMICIPRLQGPGVNVQVSSGGISGIATARKKDILGVVTRNEPGLGTESPVPSGIYFVAVRDVEHGPAELGLSSDPWLAKETIRWLTSTEQRTFEGTCVIQYYKIDTAGHRVMKMRAESGSKK